jgi:hypothetical protein
MARKPGKKSPDYFTEVFAVLYTREKEIDFAQFMFDHPGLTGLLIEAARNGDEITLEMLQEADLEEFRDEGEYSNLVFQFQLAMFLQKAVEQFGFNPLPWMGQQEEPPAEKKSMRKPAKKKTTKKRKLAKRRAAYSGSVSSATINKLGTKAQARKLIKKYGSIPALVEYLKGRGVTIGGQNLRDTLNRHYDLKISEVLSGASAKKKPSGKKKARKAAGRGKKGSTASKVVQELGGTAAKVMAALKKAGSVEALTNSLTVKVTEGNLRSILNRRFSISPREVLQGATKKGPGKKPKGSDDRSVAEQVMAKFKNKAGGTAILKKAGSMSQLLINLQGSIPGLTRSNLVYIVTKKLGIKVGKVLGTSRKSRGTE